MKVVVLAGGVGGAKLVEGLAQSLPSEDLVVIVNTGDDFEHFGLHISPDLDTVCYTLAGMANPETGWGRQNETWRVLEEIERLGGPTWFRLGDRDLATHLERTRRLLSGEPLSSITQVFCQRWGIKVKVLPMSDDPVRTQVITTDGRMLGFQEYFVALQCGPAVSGFQFETQGAVRPAPSVLESLEQADLIIIAPSNPWVSIDPILFVPGVRERVRQKRALAISPIVGGQALKGPAAKMFQELGWKPSALAVALHYGDLLWGFVLDKVDSQEAQEISRTGIIPLVSDIVMRSQADRMRLAREVLDFARQNLGGIRS